MSCPMRVKVLFFAELREKMGQSERVVDFPDGVRADEAARILGLTAPLFFAVNENLVAADQVLKEKDSLAFLMPMSGG